MTINRQSVLDAINKLVARGTALTLENVQGETDVPKSVASRCLKSYLADQDAELAKGTDLSPEVRRIAFVLVRMLRGDLEQEYAGALAVLRREFEALTKSQETKQLALETRIAEQASMLRDADDAARSTGAVIDGLRTELAASEEARKTAQSRLADLMVVQDQQVSTETAEEAAQPSALADCQDRLRIIEAKLHKMDSSSSVARADPGPRSVAAVAGVDDGQMELEDAIDRARKRDAFVASVTQDETSPLQITDLPLLGKVDTLVRQTASEAERVRTTERLWNSETATHSHDEAVPSIDEPMPKYPPLPLPSLTVGTPSHPTG